MSAADPLPVILIVDDDEQTLSILQEATEDLGVKVETAINGEDGLKTLQSNKIDVVISDLKMPVMNGIDFMRKSRDSGYHLPFIIVTGYGDKETSIKALRLGAFDFIEKPFEWDHIEATIKEAIQSSQKSQSLLEVYKKSISTEIKNDDDAVKKLSKLASLVSYRGGDSGE